MTGPARVGAALVVVGLLAACGSTDQPAEPSAPAPSSAPASSGHGAYAECLAEHGVDTPPAGPAAPPGVDPQTWAQAQQACADKAPGPAS
ncbi:hypothetical protein MARA_49750 [Mycolicibacterium arabiense]|uniref:Lipoprotein n=1 Tax=Mycolicibacterium arabiense TaxID=1286181 RepID=A0A7I7S3X2_9MYCO|nr:hypothetical protein [Mycolicibacterium arabiense]MCV7372386.1 hypothetical protein [Mycolicibacterium arabiense]BBY51507.1 hypothetical protein MARA_49750 [Mycolicibacterium arabiense]